MALIKRDAVIEFPIPHEPGEWIKARPIRAGDIEGTSGDAFAVTMQVLTKLITAWSYEDAVSAESVRDLDIKTVEWLQTAVAQASGIRTPDEKNGSTSNS